MRKLLFHDSSYNRGFARPTCTQTTAFQISQNPLGVCCFFHLATIAFFPLYLSDKWERELVELVLEVSVSQVSHRQRDMLLRQVGVLLGLLDSDIIVREISAFNEHR